MPAPAKSIDTRKIADQLTESGVPVEQAKAHASVIAGAVQMHSTQLQAKLVTKEELRDELKPVHAAIAELRAAVAELRAAVAELRAAVAELRAEVDELRAAVAALDAKLDSKVLELNAKIDMVKLELYATIEATAEKLRRDMRRDLVIAIVSSSFIQVVILGGLILKLAH